jgi:hypothetical protein
MSEETRRYTVQTRVVASSIFGDTPEAMSAPSSARTIASSSEESTPRVPSTTSSHVTLTTNVVSTSNAPSNNDPSRPINHVAWNLPTSKRFVS